ncbi:2-oxoglutarate dehydrogenase E2 component (dihydrolipoamide succinyltransferase) [Nocardioides ginsengisegetis]|uniref:Dihydrolipoamide acetyltransferase component of pyruvate dehydrogenase complex n=1 Tax=Nocardioides ginsengisegetis TaxID=661491 RepID=A0A7W3IYG7_9ACTN|nr:2-oxoglutarate dehydrogenase, E2 component, dihydrolipoamide succinyltransferase [Nocardioides ginsengisegetis]MBA8802923.1 2-oxoglutarate dehydrogenase E2 component (dihydrolipoamide succinyltransferase) [Nocardioides ginsengisegetis]
MATEVNLPALGESVTEGTVTRWLKSIGDSVAVDEPLLEVSTDKVDTEIPSPVAGTLLEIKANEDDTVEVGAVLALIGDEGESGGSSESAEAPAEEAPAEEETPEPAAEEQAEEPEEEQAPEPAAEEKPAAESKPSGGGGGGTSVTLPALGESVTEGTVTRWLKAVGDEVAVDEPLLEVSTDKVDTEIPSPVAGTLLEIKVEEDETVEVGAELAVIGDGSAAPAEEKAEEKAPEKEPEPAKDEPKDEPKAEPKAEEKAPEKEPEPAKEEPKAEPKAEEKAPEKEPEPAAESTRGGDAAGYVTPLVRKMAGQHGVDLSTVTGTGVGGRIRKQDVLDAAAAKQQPAAPAAAPAAPAAAASSAPVSTTPSPLRGTTEKMSRLRKIIATRMVDSLQTSAQLTQVMEVDVTNIARLRESVKADFLAREGVKLTYLPFFAKAAIDALKVHPKLNAAIDTEAGEVTYYDRENVAFAVDTEKGLLTPVVKDAGDLSIAGLAKKIADVAERTRSNKIGPDELSGGTFTITNLGSFGALFDTPIINKPQVAILGPGAVIKRPVVIDDPNLGETIAVRQMVYLSLSYDHQLVDGADAGRFLKDVKQRLEAGQFEV